MLVRRLRNAKDRDHSFEELSALLPRKTLEAMRYLATAEKHSFWFVNLLNERDELFFKHFEQRMAVASRKKKGTTTR